ncbi:hypothetical protein [uncultured Selenomonas sp.]|uniref:hypothetical protein n=1 Tax=uncultured Selenomonas sp. TaxID=159275 RepID=UPI0028DCD8B1|nr:hypothetical protein [uncultured Selenomonas sp.]
MAITDALYAVIVMRVPQDYRRNLQKMREGLAKKWTEGAVCAWEEENGACDGLELLSGEACPSHGAYGF